MANQLPSGFDGQKAHICKALEPLFPIRCALFQVPYPASPLLACPPRRATLTKTAGRVPTIPILELNTLLCAAPALSAPPRYPFPVFASQLSTFNCQLSTSVFPALHYPLHFGRTACRPARTPGNCSASTPLPRACASTSLQSKRVSAP